MIGEECEPLKRGLKKAQKWMEVRQAKDRTQALTKEPLKATTDRVARVPQPGERARIMVFLREVVEKTTRPDKTIVDEILERFSVSGDVLPTGLFGHNSCPREK